MQRLIHGLNNGIPSLEKSFITLNRHPWVDLSLVAWISPLSASLNFFARALVTGPTGTWTGSLDKSSGKEIHRSTQWTDSSNLGSSQFMDADWGWWTTFPTMEYHYSSRGLIIAWLDERGRDLVLIFFRSEFLYLSLMNSLLACMPIMVSFHIFWF